jgi:hypothetical protein
MQFFNRIIHFGFLALVLAAPVWGKTPAKEAEYKQTDTNFYFKSSVLKADPGAVFRPMSDFQKKGDSYFFHPRVRAPKEIYVEEMKEWLEPITPPSMPVSLGIAPDAMQIREPQGDVQVALPSNPAAFVAATDQMALPNGSVVKTGADGSAAVLFGGVNSVRFAPNSQGAVQQTVTPVLRSTEVDLRQGAAFSKVGLRAGEKQDYQVHTPFGVAAARGTDFVSVVMPDRTDVWIAQGTVELDQPNGQTVGTVKSDGKGSLKIIRFPVMADPHQAMLANAETMTMAMNFIPMADLKVKALRERVAQGGKLTPQERKYLSLIKKIPVLIKLTLVEPPPPPPPAPVVAPIPDKAKQVEAAPVPTAAPSSTNDIEMTGPGPTALAIKSHGMMEIRPGDTPAADSSNSTDKPAVSQKTTKPKKVATKTKPKPKPEPDDQTPAPVATGPHDTVP